MIKQTIQVNTKKRQPRECHKCPRNGKGDPYCWQHCLGPSEKSGKGLSKVSLDAMEAEDEFLLRNAKQEIFDQQKIDPDSISDNMRLDNQPTTPQNVTATLTDEVERALVPIIASLMSLSDIQLCIFRHIFKGQNIRTTGETLPTPISKQAVFKHLKQMVKANPVVKNVIQGMMRRGQGGAKRQVSQAELFEFNNTLF